ncbi:hypothetical protein N0Y54_33910 [Nostoc punctiforme UO1]|uniref:hypothetical protein n=1 Tax=Nostoc punctiforme TaxID=272131 RepID=UPI003097107D
MYTSEAFRLLLDQSGDTQVIQQSMTSLIEGFIEALKVKPKIMRDFSRIVRQGKQNLGEGYLLVDIGPMYVVQLDVNFTPVRDKDVEKGSLDVIWMNEEFTRQFFSSSGKHLWLNLKKHIKSAGDNQFVLSVFLNFDRGENFPENRNLLSFKHIIVDLC